VKLCAREVLKKGKDHWGWRSADSPEKIGWPPVESHEKKRTIKKADQGVLTGVRRPMKRKRPSEGGNGLYEGNEAELGKTMCGGGTVR